MLKSFHMVTRDPAHLAVRGPTRTITIAETAAAPSGPSSMTRVSLHLSATAVTAPRLLRRKNPPVFELVAKRARSKRTNCRLALLPAHPSLSLYVLTYLISGLVKSELLS